MTGILPAFLYFLKVLLKAACLLCLGRFAFGFPYKRRRVLPAVLLVLLAAASALTTAPLPLAEVDRRMLADAATFCLCLALPLSVSQAPRHLLGTSFCASLLLEFSAELLYSMVAEVFGDAIWWEAAFSAGLYAVLLCVFLLTEKHSGFRFLQGAFRNIPKPVWAALLFFEFTCYYRTFGNMLSWYRFFAAVSAVAVLLTLAYLIFLLVRYADRQNDLLRQIAEQKDYGERLQRSDEELRAFRHDYKNHLIVIRSYLENGNTEAAKAYFDSINALSPEALRKVSTGNFAADALITYKLHTAEEKNVQLSFEGWFPPGGVRDEDLCAILSNLLDNAVEASAPLEGQKNVRIEAVSRNGYLVLCVTNPTANADRADGGGTGTGKKTELPGTTKADKKNHGYGLKNVKKTVQKYGGSFTVDAGAQSFSANVMLKWDCLPQKERQGGI